MDSRARRPVSWPTLAPSRVTPIPRTAASTTSAWRAWPANTDAPSALCSRSATVTALATARIPRMFPDGKCYDYFPKIISKTGTCFVFCLALHSENINARGSKGYNM